MGFSDAGAHLRNMAFYNFPLRLLRRARDTGFMPVERAVHRLTGELAEWYAIDAGTLRVGDRADLVIVDPVRLDAGLDELDDAPMAGFGGYRRMVNRNDDTVIATLVAGTVVHRRTEAGAPASARDLAPARRTGRFLRVGEPRGTVDPHTVRWADQESSA
jgi:N-acyl-D-aspartate/D-glutamate deacylase